MRHLSLQSTSRYSDSLGRLARRLPRCTALALPAAVLMASAPAQLLHRYSFDTSGTQVVDSVGGADGVAFGGASMAGAGVLDLDGVDDYVELPSGLVSTLTDATIEAWVTPSGSSVPSWARVFDFNETSAGPGMQGSGINYFFIAASSSMQVAATGIKLSTPGSIKVFAGAPTPTGVETHFVMVYSGSTDELFFYVDGVLQGIETVTDELTDFSDVNCWLGQSFTAADARFAGAFNEFRIHDGAFSGAQVAASFTSGPDASGVGTSYCGPAVPNTTGLSGVMSAQGSDVAADNSLVLSASDLPLNQFAIFITGKTQGFLPNPGGSQGNLCIVGALGRYNGPGQLQNSGATGTVSLVLDLTMTPTPSVPTMILAGETWNFQAWYRDWITGQGAVSNFTDAVSIQFQ